MMKNIWLTVRVLLGVVLSPLIAIYVIVAYAIDEARDESGMVAPVHLALGAIIGLLCVLLGASLGQTICAVIAAFYSHAWVDAYNRDIDHIIEDNKKSEIVKYWVIVAAGMSLFGLTLWRYPHIIVVVCALAASGPDLDWIFKYIPGYPSSFLHKLFTHPILVDEGSNVARAICILMLFGVLLF